MATAFFLIFCLAIGYVCLWVVMNERQGSLDGGAWGLLQIRRPRSAKSALPFAAAVQRDGDRKR